MPAMHSTGTSYMRTSFWQFSFTNAFNVTCALTVRWVIGMVRCVKIWSHYLHSFLFEGLSPT